MEKTHSYSKGEWLVHTQYGIGQVKGVDVKDISGEDSRYYRVQAADSTFWIPVDQVDSEIIRPLSTPEEIQQAITTLQNPPEAMSSNFKIRQQRIQKARARNTPRAFARTIRDLRAYRRKKGVLNSSERSAYRTLKKRLAEEWAIVTAQNCDEIASIIEQLLDPKKEAPDKQDSAIKPVQPVSPSASVSAAKQEKWWGWTGQKTR